MSYLGLQKPLRHCSLSDLFRFSENKSVRASQAQRKYSVGLLEEAFRLSKQVGLAEAARQAGINYNSLKHYKTLRNAELGTPGRKGTSKITLRQKRECLQLATQLRQARFATNMRDCWIEAGRRMGINGRSVEFQYVRGFFS